MCSVMGEVLNLNVARECDTGLGDIGGYDTRRHDIDERAGLDYR